MPSNEQVVTIQNMPLRGGLMTAGHRAIIPESGLWEAKNMTFDMDGTIQKRPGVSTWNTFALKRATPLENTEALLFEEPFNDLANFDTLLTTFHVAARFGRLEFSVETTTGLVHDKVWYDNKPSTTPTLREHSFRFLVRIQGVDAAPAGIAQETFMVTGGNGSILGTTQFGFFSDGLYYRRLAPNEWTKVTGSDDIVNGQTHELEVRSVYTGNTTVYLDGTLIATIATSEFDVATPSQGYLEFGFGQGTTRTAYSGQVWGLMYKNDATTPFEATPVTNITDFDKLSDTGDVRRYVVAATAHSIHIDTNFKGEFFLLQNLQYPETNFSRFRDRLIFVNHDNGGLSDVYSWNGIDAPVVQEDAPNIRFATEHKTRLWGAGNVKHPLRLYYSASRQENVWFDPEVDNDETSDEVLNAGYLEIPPRGGSRITALFGDHYGDLIVFTDKGIWRVSGVDRTDFQVQAAVSNSEGAVGPNAITPVGNDLWFVGGSGVYSLSATEQYGDLITQTVSAPILNLWTLSRFNQATTNTTALSKARLAYLDRSGQVHMALPSAASNTLDNVYVFSLSTQQWIGPWEVDATGMGNITLGYPLRTNTVFGLSTGQLGFINPMRHTDHDGDYAISIKLPLLNGRSIGDPRLTGRGRRFRSLRLYFNARGNWPFDIQVQKDGINYQDVELKQGQAVRFPAVDKDFAVDIPTKGRLTDEDVVIPVEFELDGTGNYMAIKLSTDAVEEHFVLQGYEVDIIPAGPAQGVY